MMAVEPETFTVRLTSLPDQPAPASARLKGLLKIARRSFSMKCVSVSSDGQSVAGSIEETSEPRPEV
jgi:hypothetical protein